ncbi:MAG: aminopeptidase [Flavobacteriales bacterium]|jgi:bleomycin hydrolase|nr:MAG: aminopeptidase [Flavobacteriales bacterium]
MNRTLPSIAITILGATLALQAHAQDDLIKKISLNSADSTGFKFTQVLTTPGTPVEDQGSSGTCWSYSTGSFLESEMIKKGGPSIPLSKIYIARKSYEEKARSYVRMHGSLNYGDGGIAHDVVNMYVKHGIMPYEAYTGLNFGNTKNQTNEMQAVIKAMLDAIVKAPNKGTLTPVWPQAVNAVMDTYLGKVPETFTYNGKSYTPQTFAKEVVKLDGADYLEFQSVTDVPYYTQSTLMVPDNWALAQAWNIPVEDITTIIDNALKNGYSVAWGGDVSEPSFSWRNGVAFVTMTPAAALTKEQKATLFHGPQPEPVITAEMRQAAFDDFSTTDDHGMHITGMAKDQNGAEWYIVKNSWGTSNDQKGYLYMSKAYAAFKMTAFMVNKKAVPAHLLKKLGQ